MDKINQGGAMKVTGGNNHMQLYSTTGGSSLDLSTFINDLVESNLAGVLAAAEPESSPEPVKLAGSPVEGVIIACCEKVKAMAGKFARNASRLEFDDLYSIGMLAICEAASKLKPEYDPFPYLLRAAKLRMIDEYRRVYNCSPLSLDAPLADDSTLCLADVLPAPAPATPVVSKRSRALNGAMARLSSTQQRAALRRRYGLPGYGSGTLKKGAGELHTSVNALYLASRRGVRNLARDPRLCSVVGVEVAQ